MACFGYGLHSMLHQYCAALYAGIREDRKRPVCFDGDKAIYSRSDSTGISPAPPRLAAQLETLCRYFPKFHYGRFRGCSVTKFSFGTTRVVAFIVLGLFFSLLHLVILVLRKYIHKETMGPYCH